MHFSFLFNQTLGKFTITVLTRVNYSTGLVLGARFVRQRGTSCLEFISRRETQDERNLLFFIPKKMSNGSCANLKRIHRPNSLRSETNFDDLAKGADEATAERLAI